MPINLFRVTVLNNFKHIFTQMQDDLIEAKSVDVGEWQSIHKPMLMHELRNVSMSMPLPESAEELADITGAHLPWAEDHFKERVGGEPLNPSPSEAWWPFAQKKANSTNGEHKSEGEAFSHTYPERMWPRMANANTRVTEDLKVPGVYEDHIMHGIRFDYGDLDDVVDQLVRSPMTRQAYLPIWFPEDTGAVHLKRVPCTLGYHFAIRDGKLDITYYMRSTDLLRHFQDDIYLAGRLAQWVANEATMRAGAEGSPDELEVGELIFHTANLHIFEADLPMINYRKGLGNHAWNE